MTTSGVARRLGRTEVARRRVRRRDGRRRAWVVVSPAGRADARDARALGRGLGQRRLPRGRRRPKGFWRTDAGARRGDLRLPHRCRSRDGRRAARGLGLGCNGVVDVLLERAGWSAIDPLAVLETCVRTQTCAVVATVIASGTDSVPLGARLAIRGDELYGVIGDDMLTTAIVASAKNALRARTTSVATYGDVRVLLEVFVPPPRLFVLGAGHDAVPLVSDGARDRLAGVRVPAPRAAVGARAIRAAPTASCSARRPTSSVRSTRATAPPRSSCTTTTRRTGRARRPREAAARSTSACSAPGIARPACSSSSDEARRPHARARRPRARCGDSGGDRARDRRRGPGRARRGAGARGCAIGSAPSTHRSSPR